MAKILDMPKLSPTMEEGVLSSWHKKEGDAIGVDDLLAEVETDKATMEFRAFDKGTLLKILVAAGCNVKARATSVAIVGERRGGRVCALAAQAGATAGPAPQASASANAGRTRRTRRQERARSGGGIGCPPPRRHRQRARSARRPAPAQRKPAAARRARSHLVRPRVLGQPEPQKARRARASSPYVRKVARERSDRPAGRPGERPRRAASSPPTWSPSEAREPATALARRGMFVECADDACEPRRSKSPR